jgi:hypothetical protein
MGGTTRDFEMGVQGENLRGIGSVRETEEVGM